MQRTCRSDSNISIRSPLTDSPVIRPVTLQPASCAKELAGATPSDALVCRRRRLGAFNVLLRCVDDSPNLVAPDAPAAEASQRPDMIVGTRHSGVAQQLDDRDYKDLGCSARATGSRAKPTRCHGCGGKTGKRGYIRTLDRLGRSSTGPLPTTPYCIQVFNPADRLRRWVCGGR